MIVHEVYDVVRRVTLVTFPLVETLVFRSLVFSSLIVSSSAVLLVAVGFKSFCAFSVVSTGSSISSSVMNTTDMSETCSSFFAVTRKSVMLII